MVVFDLDDTLYPEMQFVLGGFRPAAGVMARAIGVSEDEIYQLFVDILSSEGPRQVFNKAFVRLGLKESEDLIKQMVEVYRFHEPRLSPFPGITELLSLLKAQQIGLGMITDGPLAVQSRKVRALGIAHYFEHIVFSDGLGGVATWKPSPRPFEEIERLSGLEGKSLIYIGDNPSKDFQGAEARSWRTIRVRFPGTFHCHKEDSNPLRPVADSVENLKILLLEMLEAPV